MGTKPSGSSAASQSLTSDGWKQLIKRRNDSTGGSSYYDAALPPDGLVPICATSTEVP